MLKLKRGREKKELLGRCRFHDIVIFLEKEKE